MDGKLTNVWWDVLLEGGKGGVLKLVACGDPAALADAVGTDGADMKEGGSTPYRGLETWIKTGPERDSNTGVLTSFAALHAAPRILQGEEGRVILESAAGGLRFRQTWSLAAGEAPLVCESLLENVASAPAELQFEYFFTWRVDGADWTRTAYWLPGGAVRTLPDYGEIRFDKGEDVSSAAVFWTRGGTHGAVVRAGTGMRRYFAGNQSGTFIMGLNSVRRVLAPGDRLEARLELWPVPAARATGLIPELATLEARVKDQEQVVAKRAAAYPDVRAFAGEPDTRGLARRALHLTFQYARAPVDDMVGLIRDVAAPLGYNQLMIEIGRAFPYRTHPRSAAPWAYSRAEWRRLLAAARGAGMEVIPQYNALGHQRESGLGAAYPEMCEDSDCWCLDADDPRTQPYLRDVIGELCDFFEPALFHIGLDEADVPSRARTFACPREGREREGGDMLARHILGLHGFLKARGIGCLMWADMLLYKPEHNSRNGLRSGAWTAIDRLPRDLIMMDWVYNTPPAYGGTEYLLAHGFPVMGATWHMPDAIASFARYAAERGLYGMCETTWSRPLLAAVPAVCVFMAGRLFRRPFDGPWEAVRDESEAQAFRAARPTAGDGAGAAR